MAKNKIKCQRCKSYSVEIYEGLFDPFTLKRVKTKVYRCRICGNVWKEE